MIKISLLILYFQAINLAFCWDEKEPLILNLNGDEISFPVLVDKTNIENEAPQMTYVDPGDETTSTYTFCEDYSTHRKGLLGLLLDKKTPRRCQRPVGYVREQIKDTDGKGIRCGFEFTDYYEYKTAFKLLIGEKELTIDSYNYCYDHSKRWSTLYAYYDLENPSLLKNKYLEEEQKFKYILERPTLESYERDILRFYEDQREFDPYEVAVSEFIPYGHWRKSFYQWHNKAPLHKALHAPWKQLITNVRSKLAQKTEPIKVISGVFGVQRAGNEIRYLPRSEMTIPMAWWIVLLNKDKTKAIALIMHNFFFDGGIERQKPWCEESQCDNAGLEHVVPEDGYAKRAMIYCCPASAITSMGAVSTDILPNVEELLTFLPRSRI